jgi:hypothetical protein
VSLHDTDDLVCRFDCARRRRHPHDPPSIPSVTKRCTNAWLTMTAELGVAAVEIAARDEGIQRSEEAG